MIYYFLIMMFNLCVYTFIFKDLQELKQDILKHNEDINRLKIQTNYLLYEKKED